MAYLLDIPVAVKPTPEVPSVVTPPAPVTESLPARVESRAVAAPPKPARLPLCIRIDQGLKPLWDFGAGTLVAGTAVPALVCLLGGAIAALAGSSPMPWINAISLVSPLGTVGLPTAMIMVRTCADLQRVRMRRAAGD